MVSASRFCEVSEDEIECLLESVIPEKVKMFFAKCVSTKTIRLFALDFYVRNLDLII